MTLAVQMFAVFVAAIVPGLRGQALSRCVSGTKHARALRKLRHNHTPDTMSFTSHHTTETVSDAQ